MMNLDQLAERNKAYENRCCDWHWGDSGGRGDPIQECRGKRYPDRRVVVVVNGRRASVREHDIRYASGIASEDPAVLLVRISNLESMNDNLRVNNDALRASNRTLADAIEKMASPVLTVTRNSVHIDDPGPGKHDAHEWDHESQTATTEKA